MGASDRTIHRIFLLEGLLLTGLGMALGLILAVVLYMLQKTFGLVTIPQGFLVQSYPISMRLNDFVPVILTVGIIGLIASLLPASRAKHVPAYLREE